MPLDDVWSTSVPGSHLVEAYYTEYGALGTFAFEVAPPPPVPPNGDRIAEPLRAAR